MMNFQTFFLLTVVLFVSACGSTQKKNQTASNRSENTTQVRSGSPEMLNVELGVGYLQRGKAGDLDIALKKFKKAVIINPKYALAHSMLANVYDQKGLFSDAEKHYKLSMKYNNNSPSIINNYANFLCQREKFDESVALYLKVVQDPEYQTPAVAYENAGICMKNAGQLAKAETYFRKALQHNQNMPNSLYNLMLYNLNQKQYLKARAFLQRLESVIDTNPEVLAAGYKIEKALNNNKLARRYYSQLKKSFPNSEVFKQLE